MNTIQELYAAQHRLSEAQEAERLRIAGQSAPQREVAAAQANVARLSRQARQEQFERYAELNEAAIEAVRSAQQAVLDALGRGDVVGARALTPQADQAWQEHDRLFMAAMGTVYDDIQAEAERQNAAMPVRTSHSDSMNWQQAAYQWEKRLKRVYSFFPYALAAWIAQSPDPLSTQMRIGFAYALTGQWLAPTPGYDPMNAYLAEQRLRR